MEKTKSTNIKAKNIFSLNHNIFSQNLPKLFESRFLNQENHFSSPKKQIGLQIPTKKTIKLFQIPNRFKKNNNKMENNMRAKKKTSTQFQLAVSKTCPFSFYKPVIQQDVQGSNLREIKNKIKNRSVFVQKPANKYIQPKTILGIQRSLEGKCIEPKTMQGIQRQIEGKYLKNEDERRMRQERLSESKQKSISDQVSEILSRNRNSNILSRFTVLQLKSYYIATLNFARGDIKKFKYAFQIMLNLANMTVRENVMTQCLRQLVSQEVTFCKFLKSFTNIQERLRKEAITDYFEILLEQIEKPSITFDELLRTFEGRMKSEIAGELTEFLYQILCKQLNETIDKQEIFDLCYSNEKFCAKFYLLNSQNMLSNKFNVKDKN